MIEIALVLVLVFVIVSLLAYHAWFAYIAKQGQDKLINAIIARNATELQTLTYTDKLKPEEEIPKIDPDLIPETEMTDEQWFEAIEKEAAHARES